MIEYVLPHNPDDRIISKACDFLKSGKLVCLPTDTNWTLLADPYNKDSMDKLYKIKKENAQKHFSLICNDISMANDVAIITNQAFKLLKKTTPGHYTFIFEASKKISKAIKASKTDKEVGVRIIPSQLVKILVEKFDSPVISTNITTQILDLEESADVYSYMIEDCNISHLIGLIIDPGEVNFTGQSTIVSFVENSEGIPEIIREGAGDPTPFKV